MLRRAILAAVAGMFSLQATGCLSNEYRISRDELRRLAQRPPEQRGRHVRVVQQLGERRAAALDGEAAYPLYAPGAHAAGDTPAPHWQAPADPAPPAAIPPPSYSTVHVSTGVHWDLGYVGGHRGGVSAPAPRAVTSAPPAPRSVVSAPPAPAVPAPAAAPARAPTGAVPAKATPSSGGSFRSVPAGGGGAADDLVVVAVIAVAVAALAAVGLAATEGLRFDGFADLAPAQPIHVRDPGGRQRVVPLYALSPTDAAYAEEALVMDDEGYGLRLLRRAPLDRRGAVFKVDLGTTDLAFDRYSLWGLASNVQIGYFPHHRFGLLASARFGGADAGAAGTVIRHAVGVEAQIFPLRLGRLHLGGLAHAGLAVGAAPERSSETGSTFGAGAIMELDLTTRMALTFRADWTCARLGNTCSRATAFTMGIAIY